MELDDVIRISRELSQWAHLATVGADGAPDVVPVHPVWHDGAVWALTGAEANKVRNIAAEQRVALHWQVTEAGDNLEVWGRAVVHTDAETKRRLWTGVFDYDLNLFAPDGPDGPSSGFIEVVPTRAVYLKAYGSQGVSRWKA